MTEKTIKVSTLKAMINREYDRSDWKSSGQSTLIGLAAQIEEETGVVIFDDGEDECEATLSDSLPDQTSQNTPAKSITTASDDL